MDPALKKEKNQKPVNNTLVKFKKLYLSSVIWINLIFFFKVKVTKLQIQFSLSYFGFGNLNQILFILLL